MFKQTVKIFIVLLLLILLFHDVNAFTSKKREKDSTMSLKSIQRQQFDLLKGEVLSMDSLYTVVPSFNRNDVNTIMPGTNWCGYGNRSKSFNHLGLLKRTDKCCRENDICPYQIPPLTTQYRLYNHNFFTVKHCKCENKFKNCLEKAERREEKAGYFGRTYFTYISGCFDFFERKIKNKTVKAKQRNPIYRAKMQKNFIYP